MGPPFLAFVASFSLLLLYTPAILKLPGKFSFLFCFLVNSFGKSCGTAVRGSRKSVFGGCQRNIECWGLGVFDSTFEIRPSYVYYASGIDAVFFGGRIHFLESNYFSEIYYIFCEINYSCPAKVFLSD